MKYDEIPDISLKMIIDAGLIKPDINVYAASDNKIVGKLNGEGAIILVLNNKEKVFPFPSGAARAIVRTSVNGWKFWRILENGNYKELSDFKKEYKQRF